MKKILLISILLAGCASHPRGHETDDAVRNIDASTAAVNSIGKHLDSVGSDAQRIDDKAEVLLQSEGQP